MARLRLGSDALRKRWIRLDGATADDSERAHLGRFLPLFHLGLPVSVPLHLISSRWEPSMMLFQPNQFAYLRKRLIDLCARVSSLSLALKPTVFGCQFLALAPLSARDLSFMLISCVYVCVSSGLNIAAHSPIRACSPAHPLGVK